MSDRPRDPERPWYAYAERLLPAAAGRRWIDLGCGRGEFLERARAGFGLDRERAHARAALALGRPALVADLGRPLPFATGSLDGASLIEVIEHVFAAEALAAELFRVIRPGGWLLVSTPNTARLRYRWRALRGHPPKQEGRHSRFFTRRRLGTLLGSAGFRLRARASYARRLGALPALLEPLLARRFVWRLERPPEAGGG